MRICRRWQKQRSANLFMWVSNFSSLSIITPRYVTSVDIVIAEVHTVIVWHCTLASCCLVQIQKNCVDSSSFRRIDVIHLQFKSSCNLNIQTDINTRWASSRTSLRKLTRLRAFCWCCLEPSRYLQLACVIIIISAKCWDILFWRVLDSPLVTR